ncbi:MAG: hypothetical protein RIC52_04655 [Amphiplicatus sp.]
MRAEYRAGSTSRALSGADWLRLAAAPTFAVMALATIFLGGGEPDILCSVGRKAAALDGMAVMYLLMSAFHSAPWLTLIAQWRNAA